MSSKIAGKNHIKKIFKTIKLLFFVIFLAVSTTLLFSSIFVDDNKDKSILDHNFFVVLSDSMKPEFSAGDLIIVKNVDSTKLKVGDIITFHSIDPFSFNEIITHEIVGITTYQDKLAFTTKGQNNNTNDLVPVPVDKVLGKYQLHLPKAGYAIDFLKTDIGYVIFIAIPFLLLIGLEAYSIIKKFKQDKQKDIDLLRQEKELLEKELEALKKVKSHHIDD